MTRVYDVSFDKLLVKDKSVNIHQRKLESLATKIFCEEWGVY